MAIFLLKKSYQASNQKEIGFKDLWGSYGIFTTMRLVGKPGKLVLFKSHFNVLWIHGLVHLFGHDHKKEKDFNNFFPMVIPLWSIINICVITLN